MLIAVYAICSLYSFEPCDVHWHNNVASISSKLMKKGGAEMTKERVRVW
jgi:hypothetical protein